MFHTPATLSITTHYNTFSSSNWMPPTCQYGQLIPIWCIRNLLLDNNLPQNVVTLTNNEYVLSHSSWVRSSRVAQPSDLVWGCLMQFQSRCWLKSLDILVGTGGDTAKMAPSHCCCQEAWLSCHVVLFISLHEHPHDMAADSSQVSDPRKRVRRKSQCS